MVKGSNRNSDDETAITVTVVSVMRMAQNNDDETAITVMGAFSNQDGTRNNDGEMAVTMTRAFSNQDGTRNNDDKMAMTVTRMAQKPWWWNGNHSDGGFSNMGGTKTMTMKRQSQWHGLSVTRVELE